MRKMVPPALCISIHLVVEVKLQDKDVLLSSKLIVCDGRIDLVHPFFAALARSAILAAAQIELFRDSGPLVRHPGLARSGCVEACDFSQNFSLRVSPVFLITHYVLGELPSLLTLMNRPIGNKLTDNVPVAVCKIFGMLLFFMDNCENSKLEQQSFIPTPLGLRRAGFRALVGLLQLQINPFLLLESQHAPVKHNIVLASK